MREPESAINLPHVLPPQHDRRDEAERQSEPDQHQPVLEQVGRCAGVLDLELLLAGNVHWVWFDGECFRDRLRDCDHVVHSHFWNRDGRQNTLPLTLVYGRSHGVAIVIEE